MLVLVDAVLKVTFGFLTTKIRKEMTERLKDGDAVHVTCRNLVMRELDDIKSKLDGLARKDLLSSICFLQEGINSLYQALSQFESENTAGSTEQATSAEAEDIDLNDSFKHAATFINAIDSCKSSSNERFKSAIESFKLAREKATEAFCNEALSVEDRIQALQVRVTARILEKLEDPDAAVSDCLQYLKQLHDMGPVQKAFSVLIDGALFFERLRKTTRLNYASSVHLMSQVLFDFARKFTSVRPRCFAEWPTILFDEKSYHPLFGEGSVVEKLEKSGVKVMSPYPDFKFGDKIFPPSSVINSKGDIIAEMSKENTIKIFQPSRSRDSTENRTFCEISEPEVDMSYRIVSMDIDAEDNLYVVAAFRENGSQYGDKLCIFDKDGNGKLKCLLPIVLQNSSYVKLPMAVDKDGEIAILNCDEKNLYTGNVHDELHLKKFKLKTRNELFHTSRGNMRFSDFDGTNIIAAAKTAVNIFTEEGVLQRKIKIPEGYGSIASVAVNHGKNRILIQTSILAGRFSLLSFSETGELMESLCLKSCDWIEYSKVISHPNGKVAIVGETGAALLQL